MIITPSSIDAYFRTLETIFNKAYQTATPVWPKFAMTVDSQSEASIYSWMQQLSGFREWVGPRIFDDIVANGYTLTNLMWEKSIAYPRTKFEDDSYGVFAPLTAQVAQTGAYHPDVKLAELFDNGFSSSLGKCWDGQAMFSADHVIRQDKDGSQVKITNATTYALTPDSYGAVRQALRRNLGGGDNPLMSQFKTLLVVPAELEYMAIQICNKEKNNFGADNVYFGTSEVLVYNALTNTKQWFLLVIDNAIKPFVYQRRRNLEITTIVDPNDSSVKESGLFKLMADYRGAYGYGLPQLAYGSTGVDTYTPA